MKTVYKITVEHDDGINPDSVVDYAERVLQIALKMENLIPREMAYEVGNQLTYTLMYQSALVKSLGINPDQIEESQIFAYLEQIEILAATIIKMMATLKENIQGDKHELHTNVNE